MECNNNKKQRYYYIDDENLLQGIVAGLNNEDIEIIYHEPDKDWNKEILFFEEIHLSMDGLILDLRLEDGLNNIEYRGSALAQELRTRQKEGKMKSFPIILFSGNDKLQESLDKTANDLFDFCQEKSKLDNYIKIPTFRTALISLSKGYQYLSNLKEKNIESVLGIDENDIKDIRFLSLFKEQLKLPTHSIAKFIISELLEKQGFLISESILASRLGIDKDTSEDWGKFKDKTLLINYNGVFSDYWTRSWMPLLDKWWDKNISSTRYMRSLSAAERILLIKEKVGLDKLVVITKNDKSTSDSFWTVCKGTGIPIDTIDGMILDNQDNRYPWQEKEYISIEEALEETNSKEWSTGIAISEKIRLEKLKAIYGNTPRIRKY